MADRILQIIADGRPGGGTTVVLSLLEDISKYGKVDLHLCTQAGSYLAASARKLGVTVHEADFFVSRFNPLLLINLSRIIRAANPSLIHVHAARAGLPVALVRLFTRLKTPLLYTVHGYHFLKKPFGLRHLAAAAERVVGRMADKILFVCKYDRMIAEAWRLIPARTPYAVTYNGIDLASLPIRQAPKDKLIGFFGRLTYQKNPEMLLDVVEALKPAGYRFRVVGDGDMGLWTRTEAKRRGLDTCMTFLGEKSCFKGWAALSDVSALLMTSRWDAVALVVLEGMGIGIPVVSTNVGGIPEGIEDGVSGFLIGDNDPKSYAKALRRLCEDAPLRASIADNARQTVLGTFVRDKTSLAVWNVYKEWGINAHKD